mgnify:CR=1 FL=1
MTTATPNDADFESQALCHLPEVARFARSLTGDDADADDLVQDTFLTAYRQWHQFELGSECRAWLFTICRHRFYRVHERAARQVAVEDPELESLAAMATFHSAQEAGLSAAFERQEVREAIFDAVQSLSEPYREVAQLVDLHNHTYDAAALILGVPIGTVRSRLFRARRLLQERLLTHAIDAGIISPTSGTQSGGMSQ